MISLWRGTHSQELYETLKKGWQNSDLVILCPPHLKNFSFIKDLGLSDVLLLGDWPKELVSQIEFPQGRSNKVPQAVLGVFTSGTTEGEPKLVFYSRENICSSLEAIRSLFDTQRIGSLFCFPQPTHTFGLILGYMQSIVYGHPLKFWNGPYSQKSLQHWYDTVEVDTLTLGAPAHFYDLISWGQRNNISASPSYSCIIGGAKVAPDLWKDVQNILKIEQPSIGYGATEASPGVTHLAPGTVPKEQGEIGHPLPGIKIELLPEQGIKFQGPNLCYAEYHRGRLHFPETMILKDLIHSREDDGILIYRGRLDFVANRGGLKISLEDLESYLAQEYKINSAATTVPDGRLGEEIVLFVKGEHSKKDIQKQIENKFNFNIPLENIWPIADFPLNYNFKLDRPQLQKLAGLRKSLQYPVAVSDLKNFLPHSDSAIWLDEVRKADKKSGQAIVYYDPTAHYNDADGLRETSAIEWMAQATAYTAAAFQIIDGDFGVQVKRTFLAAVTKTRFDNFPWKLNPKEEIIVETECTHEVGPLRLISGRVKVRDQILAEAQLKVFAE